MIKESITILIDEFFTGIDDRSRKMNDDKIGFIGEAVIIIRFAPSRGGTTDAVVSMTLEGLMQRSHQRHVAGCSSTSAF